MRIGSLVAAAKIASVILLLQAASAAEIKVLGTTGFKPVLDELGPQFERATGHKLVVNYGSAAGQKRQIEAGEAFDLAILTKIFMDDLVKQNKVVGATHAQIARSAMGIAVRAGAPKPDVSSTEAFKRTLLAAKSVSYAPEGTTGLHLAKVFERLGIAEEMKAKTKPGQTPDLSIRAVANGEAELGFAVSSLILNTPGAELLGRFPAEFQEYVVYVTAVGPAAKDAEAAKVLISFLKAESAASVLKAKGMDP